MTQKLSYNYVKDFIEDQEYELLSDSYVNARTHLAIRCPEGHISNTVFDSFKRGHRCMQCYNENYKSKEKKLSFEYVKQYIEQEEYTLLSEDYINAHGKLTIICPFGHEYITTYAYFQSGRRCPVCAKENKGIKKKHSYKYIKSFIEKEDYKLLSNEYINDNTYLEIECPEGHKYESTFNNFRQGKRCYKCSSKHSQQEEDLGKFIKDLFPDTLLNCRHLIPPQELDIVIPSKKVAIEYGGLYWHGESKGKDKNYHLGKLKACNKKGYKLITIFEDEFTHNKEIVFSRLKHILQTQNGGRIYARNCEIREIDTNEAKQFIEKHHIQGYSPSTIKLGAYFNNKLIAAMTFSKPNIAKGGKCANKTYELNRYCGIAGCVVVGVASKLFKYFLRNFNFDEIYSYADRRWSEGNMYHKLGFEFSHNTEPNYWYIYANKRMHRFNFRKDKLKNMNSFDPNLSEVEIMNKEGYDRIFDCGNIKFVYRNKE